LKETVSRRRYDTEIKPRTGVRVYRDGFRVWPYGEPGNDWLKLDSRRVNNPTKCFSNNQILGIVNVSGDSNPRLVDKTDREGIIDSEAFEDFRNLVLFAISAFEVERKQDRRRIFILRRKMKRYDRTNEAIDKLRSKLKRRKDLATYKQEIVDIENAYFAENDDGFFFTSEIKSLLSFIDPEENKDCKSYSAFEICCERDTVFKDVYSLLPGEYLIYDGEKKCFKKYWNIEDNWYPNVPENEDEVAEELEYLIHDAIDIRTGNSIHDFGCLLSGGVDSSVVTVLGHRALGDRWGTASALILPAAISCVVLGEKL